MTGSGTLPQPHSTSRSHSCRVFSFLGYWPNSLPFSAPENEVKGPASQEDLGNLLEKNHSAGKTSHQETIFPVVLAQPVIAVKIQIYAGSAARKAGSLCSGRAEVGKTHTKVNHSIPGKGVDTQEAFLPGSLKRRTHNKEETDRPLAQ